MDAELAPVNMGPYNLYADRSPKDEQLLTRSMLRKTKI
jgi:hypothetical protein